MADIFLSYAREDLETARRVADAIESEGWSVFWDRQIPVGLAFDDYIAEQIAACRAVVVLWSPNSVKSNWVKIEAAHGLDRETSALVPIKVAAVDPPFAFSRSQAADWTVWQPGTKSVEYTAVISRLETLAPRKSPIAATDSVGQSLSTSEQSRDARPNVTPPLPKTDAPTRGSVKGFWLLKARYVLQDQTATPADLEAGRKAARAVLERQPTDVEAKRLFDSLSQRLTQASTPKRKPRRQ